LWSQSWGTTTRMRFLQFSSEILPIRLPPNSHPLHMVRLQFSFEILRICALSRFGTSRWSGCWASILFWDPQPTQDLDLTPVVELANYVSILFWDPPNAQRAIQLLYDSGLWLQFSSEIFRYKPPKLLPPKLRTASILLWDPHGGLPFRCPILIEMSAFNSPLRSSHW
jgi:hypothetical protein